MHNDMQMIQTVKQSHRNDGVPTGPCYGKIKAHPYGATKHHSYSCDALKTRRPVSTAVLKMNHGMDEY